MEPADDRTNSYSLLPRLLKRDTNRVKLQAYTTKKIIPAVAMKKQKLPLLRLCVITDYFRPTWKYWGRRLRFDNNATTLVSWLSG
jgi:hypothetical protein